MSLKKGFIYVFCANLLSLFVSIITGFILPKMLFVNTYSEIKLFQLYVAYIGILHLGFSDGMYLKYGGRNIKDLNFSSIQSEFKTFKCFQFVITIICILGSLLIKNKVIFYCCLVILPINIGNYLRNLYQAIGKFDQYAKFTNMNTFFMFFVNFFLLFIIKTQDAFLYILGYILFYFLYWFLLEKEVKKIFGKAKVKVNTEYVKENISKGFYLMLGNFANVLFTSIDRLFVKYFLGMVQFAYYSFAVSIENLLNSVVNPISVVLFNYLCQNKEKDKIVYVKRVLLFMASLILIVIFPTKFILDLWLVKYKDSLNVLFFLFGAQFIAILIRCVHTNLYKVQNRQSQYFKIMNVIIVFSGVFNFGFYVIFRNMESFAVATFVTNLIWFWIGEFNFKEYKLEKKDYSFSFFSLLLFFICGFCFNAIIGSLLYLSGIFILSMVFMRDVLKSIKEDWKKFYQKKMKF